MERYVDFKRILLSLSCVASLAACVSIPGTDKKVFIITTREQEAQMGEQAYRELLQKERVSRDARLNAMLQRVGKRIAAQVPVSDFRWEFKLIESPEMNAFCLPGGKVAFYTGILKVLQNEDAMAIVMGHEVAHAVLRHGGQRMSEGLVVQAGLQAVDATLLKDAKYRGPLIGMLGAGAAIGIVLPFSRANETEADTFGLKYSAAAGYDPAEGPRFWARFSKAVASGGKPPQFLSTHPADSTRIENLRKLQAEAQAAYDRAPVKYGLGENI